MYLLTIVCYVGEIIHSYSCNIYGTIEEVFDKITDTLNDCEFMRHDTEVVEFKFNYKRIK